MHAVEQHLKQRRDGEAKHEEQLALRAILEPGQQAEQRDQPIEQVEAEVELLTAQPLVVHRRQLS